MRSWRPTVVATAVAVVAALTPAGALAASADGKGAAAGVAVAAVDTTMTLTGPATAVRAKPLTLTGSLQSTSGPLSGVSVGITRQDLGGQHALPARVTSASGGFTVPDTPPVGGAVTYTATWAGDTTYPSARKSLTVAVSRLATALTIRTDRTLYAYGARAGVTAHLGTTYNGRLRTVSIYARPLGLSVPWPGKLLRTGLVSAAGTLWTSYQMTRKTSFTVRFAGDYRYAPATRTVTTNTRSKVTVATKGSAGMSGGYWLFESNPAHFTAGVAPPRPGGCVAFSAQAYVSGWWQTTVTLSCATLDSTSHALVSYTTHLPYGTRLRLHASASGNAVNAPGVSPWLYFKFV